MRRRGGAVQQYHHVTRENPAEPCPNCGSQVARSRQEEHFREPDCLVDETRQWLELAGWSPVGFHLSDVRAALGVPRFDELSHDLPELVYAPSRVETRRAGLSDQLRVIRAWWAPNALMDAVASVMVLIQVNPATRYAACRRAWVDPEWADAVKAAWSLGGRKAASRFTYDSLGRGAKKRGRRV